MKDCPLCEADAAGGASYQTLINQALREYVVERSEPLEDKIRRMVREEVKARLDSE